jgi:1-acyl-sn-glycerol-3-phosphate acyltransferase
VDRLATKLPASAPRRGNAASRALGRLVLAAFGWRIEGALPDRPKLVAAVAPHTSNWDFVFAAAAMLALGIRASWLGKNSLFRWPFGLLLRWLGGLPVDRRNAHGTVEALIDEFASHEQLVLGIAPEGTRRRVKRWKTGFYRVALGAQVPIVVVSLDYRKRAVGLGDVLTPSGDMEADFARMQVIYDSVLPKNPEQYQRRSQGNG